MEYALVLNNEVLIYSRFEEAPPELARHKGIWLPVVETTEELGPYEDLVTEITVTDVVTRAQKTVPWSLERVKEAKKNLINAEFARQFAEGFPVPTGPLAGHRLQVRNLEDRTNWLTSKGEYQAAVEAGYGDVAGATFRTQNNVTVVVTFAEGLAALRSMAVWGQIKYARLWALKDELDAAADAAAAHAIAHHEGWG